MVQLDTNATLDAERVDQSRQASAVSCQMLVNILTRISERLMDIVPCAKMMICGLTGRGEKDNFGSRTIKNKLTTGTRFGES